MRTTTRKSVAGPLAAVLMASLTVPSLYAQSTPSIAPSGEPEPVLVADPPATEVAPAAVNPDCGSHCANATATTPVPVEAPQRGRFASYGDDSDDAYSITSVAKGLSTHKPMYVLPATWSPDYDGENTEMIFQISAKHRLFGTNAYFGYSQKSFWQVYNADQSRPFRETNYNPELFYRWRPSPEVFDYWGADFGIEHESNGKSLPNSRSWNRIYVAPFRTKGKTLLYGKLWYRIPEKDKETPDDANGDDNPDILDYYGYGELHLEREFENKHLVHLMVRGNPGESHGAINLNYTIPSGNESFFWQLYVFHGYGESLIDYNQSVTRVGIGVALTR